MISNLALRFAGEVLSFSRTFHSQVTWSCGSSKAPSHVWVTNMTSFSLMRPRTALQVMLHPHYGRNDDYVIVCQYKSVFFSLLTSLPAIMDVLLSQRCGKVLVGDPHQQIYTFRGAVNALHIVPHTHIYYLTQVFYTHAHSFSFCSSNV